ncbi:MAG TPA: hypothetical protein VFA52_00020 [Candidatus Paceibacterota bacterium]|jgi:cytidylate kinase|nr:hypothetical protein [Candidatus Paceibacterota bacterium]
MLKIFISGLTAAGKTTHAKLLASNYNLQYVSASNILLKRANINTSTLSKGFWVSPAASALQSQRSSDRSIDIWVDQQMIEAAAYTRDAIFDSWGMPWLSAEPGLRIWLESSILSRWWKAIISQDSYADNDSHRILTEMNKKDNFTREYFLSNYGFDLFQDYEVFDYVLDITAFISAPTLEASKLSISKSHALIIAIVKYHISQSSEDFKNLHNQIIKYGKGIFKKSPLGLDP